MKVTAEEEADGGELSRRSGVAGGPLPLEVLLQLLRSDMGNRDQPYSGNVRRGRLDRTVRVLGQPEFHVRLP